MYVRMYVRMEGSKINDSEYKGQGQEPITARPSTQWTEASAGRYRENHFTQPPSSNCQRTSGLAGGASSELRTEEEDDIVKRRAQRHHET
jgi:hypothetical protein